MPPLSLIVRSLAAALAALTALACALVLEASVKTDMALKGAEAAGMASDPATRLQGFHTAARLLQGSWAHPLAWHAGANEAMSFVAAAIAAQTRDRAFDRLAVTAATRCVELSPIQPASWARLAAFAQVGRPVEKCAAGLCLEHSWRAAQIADPEIECARMRIAYRMGRLPPDDPHFDTLDRSVLLTRDFARCLAFLPRQQLFQVLLKRAIRNHSEEGAAESVRR
jgi:hypothetical protein